MRERAHRHPCVEKGIHTKERDRNQAVPVTKISHPERKPTDPVAKTLRSHGGGPPLRSGGKEKSKRRGGGAGKKQQKRNKTSPNYKKKKKKMKINATNSLGALCFG